MSRKPAVLLINFPTEAIRRFESIGTVCDLGYVREARGHEGVELSLPGVPHDYDLILWRRARADDYDDIDTTFPYRKGKHKVRELKELAGKLRQSLSHGQTMLLVFVDGGTSSGSLANLGLFELEVDRLGRAPKRFERTDTSGDPEPLVGVASAAVWDVWHMHRRRMKSFLLARLSWRTGKHGLGRFVPVVESRIREAIAGFGLRGGSNRLAFVALPAFEDDAQVGLDFLARLAADANALGKGDIFRGVSSQSWADGVLVDFPQVASATRDLQELERDHRETIRRATARVEEAKERVRHLQELLVADGDDRLKPAVARVLLELGFRVAEPLAERSRSPREDYTLYDDDGFEAVCEVKGSRGATPSAKFILQTAVHRERARGEGRTRCAGILVLNHDRLRAPESRTEPYHDQPELLRDAEAVTVVATTTLFALVRDIRKGVLTQAQARKFLKKSGLVSYPV